MKKSLDNGTGIVSISINPITTTMNKLALTLILGTSLFAGLAAAHAYDTDPGYGKNPGYGQNQNNNQASNQRAIARYQPLYYRPVQRYYGKGYTIAYNYVPVTRQSRPVASDYEPQSLNISSNKIAAYGLKNPRIAYSETQSGTRAFGTSSIAKRPALAPAVALPPPVTPTEPPPVASGPEPK